MFKGKDVKRSKSRSAAGDYDYVVTTNCADTINSTDNVLTFMNAGAGGTTTYSLGGNLVSNTTLNEPATCYTLSAATSMK